VPFSIPVQKHFHLHNERCYDKGMWNLQKLAGLVRGKRYTGVIAGGLPARASRWGKSDYLRANEISLYVNRALAKRSEKVGDIDFELHDAKGNEIENDPLLDLLSRPNKLFTGRQFWKLYQNYYDIFGEVYIYRERVAGSFGEKAKTVGLHILKSDLVTPKFNADGSIEKFEYKTNTKTTEYQADEVLYVFNPDPAYPLRGASLLKAGVNAIQTDAQISAYHASVLENGGKVEGVFKFKTGMLSEDQLKQLKDRYDKEYGDARKSGKPLFLGGDAEYIRTGMSPAELAYLEAKKMTLEDICILTGVPKSLLASTNDVKFDNADADRAIFLGETIRPLLKTLATALDEMLFPDDRTLTFKDPTPENVDQKLKETESGIKNYYLTINEARERHGYDPIDGGDTLLVPFSVLPLDHTGEAPTPEAKSVHNKAVHPLQDEDVRAMYGKIQVKRMNVREKKFKGTIAEYLKGQENRIVEALAPTKNRVYRKKGMLDGIWDAELEVSIGKDAFGPVLQYLLAEAGQDAINLAGGEQAFNVNADIRTWLDNRTGIFLRVINDTTFKQLEKQFEESIDANEDRETLIQRIQDTYGNINKHRAGTIARTEVHNSTQYGALEGYKQAGLGIKIWVSVIDGHTRDSHAYLDGEERPLDTPFTNGLMFPGDPKGDAGEVINCRCTI